MERPCVRVPRDRGEETRRALDEADALDRDHEIDATDEALYLPVDPDAITPGLAAELGLDADELATVEADAGIGTDETRRVTSGARLVTRDVAPRRTQTTPADLLGFEPSIERLGDIVVVDEDDPERGRAIAEAVMASDLPAGTVVNRASEVRGEHRVRDWEVLAGDGTETVHREYGHEFALDIATVYFSPRLATERHRVVRQADEGEFAIDMFAGVGPFAVPMAARGASVVAIDLNPEAIRYLRENVARNGVAERVTIREGDVREVAPAFADRADRLVMNLPHSADEFVDAAVEMAGPDAVVHYYDIQPDDDPFGPGETAIRAAAEPAGYDIEVLTRHEVRSYAPHELNVCLDVRLTRS
jgi:tRNA (guanine37-N1)-methyltransferase